MRLPVILFLLSVLIVSIHAEDRSKADSEQKQASNSPSASQPSVPIVQINIGTANAPSPQPEKRNANEETRPFITAGEWLISGITGIYAIVSIFTFFAIRRQANIAERSANAAVAAEAAWIMVNLEFTPGYHGVGQGATKERDQPETFHSDVTIRLICKNTGKTPAWITEKRGVFVVRDEGNPLPVKPDFTNGKVIQEEPEALASGEESRKDTYLSASQWRGLDDFAVIYGIVKYRDVFKRERETRFAYSLTLGNEFKRLAGYPEYNENT